MKQKNKNLSRVICIMMTFFLAAALVSGNSVPAKAAKKPKTVVLYFSATGTTKGAAKKIQKKTKGKLIEIKPSDPYTDSDLDYSDEDSRVTKEHESAQTHKDSSVRPTIKNLKKIQKEVRKADIVYIGYPIWWGEAPHIVYNLVENVNLKKKTVVPFCTSASSGVGKSAAYLKQNAKISSGTKWLAGKNFYDIPAQKTVNQWINKLTLK